MGTTNRGTAGGQLPKNKPITGDPLNVSARLYRQLAFLLDDLESELDITFPQRLSAMIALGRVQKMLVELRKASLDVGSGSQISRYSAAFAPANAARGGAADAGAGNVVELDRERVAPDPDENDDAIDDGEYDPDAA